MSTTSADATMSDPTSAPSRLSRPPTSAAGKRSQADRDHRGIEAGVERDQDSGGTCRKRRQSPSQGIGQIEIDPSLSRQQRVLPSRTHAQSPSGKLQQRKQSKEDEGVGHNESKRQRGNECTRQDLIGRLTTPSTWAGLRDCAVQIRIMRPRKRIPSAIVSRIAASTDLPVVQRINAK